MFEFNNRYTHLKTKTLTTATGKVIAYKSRRFLPQMSHLPIATHVVVREGDRLDLIATRLLGDPFLAWRLCDANEAMHPTHLTNTPGRILQLTAPQLLPEGQG